MKKILAFVILLISTAQAFSQNSPPIETFKLKGVDQFYVDQFQNLYVVIGPELRKYDPTYKQLYSYSNPIKGAINQADVMNALNPYIYYKDWNEVVVVDNRLNASTAINFNDYGFLDVQFISFSDQYNVWFYDQATDKLYKFRLPSKKVTNSSMNITQLTGVENVPTGMLSTINKVYLNVPEKGILVFDALGALQKTIPLKNIETFYVQGEEVYLLKENKLSLYNLSNSSLSELNIKDSLAVSSVKVSGKKLYLRTSNGIEVYLLSLSPIEK